VGCSVTALDKTGVPDLMVGRGGVTYLLECKSPVGKLTPDQVEWHRDWQGQVAIVRSVQEALQAVGLIQNDL
jgi:hypothetical protein